MPKNFAILFVSDFHFFKIGYFKYYIPTSHENHIKQSRMQVDVYCQDEHFRYPTELFIKQKTISGPFPVVHSIDDFGFNSVIEKKCHLDSLLNKLYW